MIRINDFARYKIDLCGGWKLAWSDAAAEGAVSRQTAERRGLTFHDCTVPGNFELDLHALGLLPDPFFGMNPVEVAKATEKCHVYYARTFAADAPDGAAAILTFEGLDCFADVYVNGVLAASPDNMLIEHKIEVTTLLNRRENELFVHIRPAVPEALKYEYPQLVAGLEVNYEALYVRKAPHMYGWDIMPRFVSAGIFRPVFLEFLPDERIAELYLKTVSLAEGGSSADLLLHYRFHCRLDGSYSVRLRMRCGGSTVEVERPAFFAAGKMAFGVTDPMLWWPRGRGEANLYDVQVDLVKDGRTLDSRGFTHGIRTVDLRRTVLTTSTGQGEFVFVVNGEKVFIKGSNWVPADAFHSRDRSRIPRMMELVDQLNCNMLRCWGGNVYEDEAFYEHCDRSGILVWQDFAMACGIYPQDDAFARVIADEAAAVVKRLRSHPCVTLWSGDNECDQAYRWNASHANPNTNVLTRKILPEAVRLHDGARPYIGSSPFIGEGIGNDDEPYLPENHLWGPRDYFKSKYYTASLCHFASEIGYHGCPAPDSIARFISPEKLWPCTGNDEWMLHGTAPVPLSHRYDYRIELMRKQVAELFDAVPDNLADFAFASQIAQAEAKKFFVELFRIAKWRRTGILWWNVIDGWPQFSDAVVDYYFVRKLAWYAIRNSQQDVCLMLDEPESWVQRVVLSNDTRQDKKVHCTVADIDTGEAVLDGEFTAKADRSVEIGTIPYIRNRQRFFVLTWQGEAAGRNHYLAGQPPFNLRQVEAWLKKSGLFAEALADLRR